MGKILSWLIGLAMSGAVVLTPLGSHPARAQSTPPPGCAGNAPAYPMQGHYTGPWHSQGDYHFDAFGHNIDLSVTINGTMDAAVTPDGRMTGTVQGSVDAPVTHDGQRDVSSGTGTISGAVQGVFSATGGIVVLSQPVILMHWGTFVGGGYTEDRSITMPDYQFAVGALDCVSSSGTISEQNFPVQNIVDDFNGQITQIPGIGSATGSWQLTSDSAGKFAQLAQRVDTFIAQANALLNSASPPTPSQVAQQIGQPLRQLESAIGQDPTVSRCLMDRLAAWEASAVSSLLARATSAAPADLVALRQAGDFLRSAQSINVDCAISDSATGATLTAAGQSMLDGAIARQSWSDAALLLRELVILGVPPASLQQRIGQDLHVQAQQTGDSVTLLALARASYVLGDDADATAIFQRLTAHQFLSSDATVHGSEHARKHRHKMSHKPSHKTVSKRKAKASHKTVSKPKAKPSPTPSPTPTPTSKPKTLTDVLGAGITAMSATHTSGASTVSWQPVAGAVRYVVTVAASGSQTVLWSWSGTATSATFGDTTIDGLSGSASDGWPLPFDSGVHEWSILALDQQGKIIGILLRAP